jgi:preprotein translocase subunit SecB
MVNKTTETQVTGENAAGNQFMIQRVYIKDLSFEAPNTPQIFTHKWEPELGLDINTSHTELDKGIYEVVLTVLVNVKNQGSTAFLVEIKQAGIFTIQGIEAEQLDHLLGSFCPSILFPYAREAITSEVIRASFPQLVLSPINFDALYLAQKEEKNKTKAAH